MVWNGTRDYETGVSRETVLRRVSRAQLAK
jgi:hypothetical protein